MTAPRGEAAISAARELVATYADQNMILCAMLKDTLAAYDAVLMTAEALAAKLRAAEADVARKEDESFVQLLPVESAAKELVAKHDVLQRTVAGMGLQLKQRVTQTRLHSESVNGNCMAACFASVLGGDIAEYDAIIDPLITTGRWWDAVEKIFIAHGYAPIRISVHYSDLGGAPAGVCFASGVSPRGVRHMCVMQNGKIEHDPHPSRAGLDVIDEYTIIVPWSVPPMPDFTVVARD